MPKFVLTKFLTKLVHYNQYFGKRTKAYHW